MSDRQADAPEAHAAVRQLNVGRDAPFTFDEQVLRRVIRWFIVPCMELFTRRGLEDRQQKLVDLRVISSPRRSQLIWHARGSPPSLHGWTLHGWSLEAIRDERRLTR
jgi:hypothetical protein